MKILIDIGHPAHVHYFRNFIKIMERKGHEFLVVARDRQHVFELLYAYKIEFISRGKGGKSIIGKIIYLVKAAIGQYFIARKFKPDLFIDFGTIYSGPACCILRKPYLVFEDTENTKLYSLLYSPFVSEIITPECFEGDFGKLQTRFKGYMELCYLHKNYFSPDTSVLKEIGVSLDEVFSIVRFVDWNAVHDIGYQGLSNSDKKLLVEDLEKYGKVFISSESVLPGSLEKYKLNIKAEHLHDIMYYSSLVIGESATMASEAVMMGTPAIFIDNVGRGYTRDLHERYGGLHQFTPETQNIKFISEKIHQLLSSNLSKSKSLKMRELIHEDCIDVTSFMVEIVESKYALSLTNNT